MEKDENIMAVEVAVSPNPTIKKYFSPLQLEELDARRIPHHIAVIPDGNRRWAKQRAAGYSVGHREGADTLMEIIKAAKELGIKALTLFSFSTENWNRSDEEIAALMIIYMNYLTTQREEMVNNGIKLETIGDLSRLPCSLLEVIQETKSATEGCNQFNLILALNYGSRNEICRAFRAMLEDYDQNGLNKEEFNEETISRYLDTHPWGDPDLLIRTSGECRLSNFLLWQISYTEIYISDVLWPDFSPHHLLTAVIDFQRRDRRWGGE
jgi:undecaprenyl diphosphate synthase